MCGAFSHQTILWYLVGVLQFKSVLTHLPGGGVGTHWVKAQSQGTVCPSLQVTMTRLHCHLCFWPVRHKSAVPMTSSSSQNSGKRLWTFPSSLKDVIKDTGGARDTQGKVWEGPEHGSSVPLDPGRGDPDVPCQSASHHVGRNSDISSRDRASCLRHQTFFVYMSIKFESKVKVLSKWEATAIVRQLN